MLTGLTRMEDLWTHVDHYIEERLLPHDPVIEQAVADTAAAGMPAIAVSPAQGKQLELLARLAKAAKILEIGTLGGYSTICLARALPRDGRLTTLEVDPHHAAVARRNIARAGLDTLVDVRVGKALETLPRLELERVGPFDLVFIDADKENNALYIDWAVKLGRPGTLVLVDNVVRDGEVLNAGSQNAAIRGTRRAYEFLGCHPRLESTVIQTVGCRGYDGFAMALIKEPGTGTGS
jgi:predicted O-methyltransferase YrrM